MSTTFMTSPPCQHLHDAACVHDDCNRCNELQPLATVQCWRWCATCEAITIVSKGSLLISISEGEIWTWLEKPTKHSSHENADKQSPVVHRRCGWLSQQSGDVRLDGRVTGAQSKWYWLQTPYLRETAHEQKRFHHVTQRCGVSTVDMRHGCCGS